jgi:flavin reductase (DIM6/NTAB) family NADH-FMN oxidoreductase RutF
MTDVNTGLDPARLRRVFGAHPSGVVFLAALLEDRPIGLLASSFTSVSLVPALVSTCVAHTSTTWPALRTATRLGVSVLSDGQAPVVRQLAAGGSERFADLPWRATRDDAVLLDGAAAWLEVSIEQQVRAGDHDIVVLAVHDLDADHDVAPLVFHASRFARLQS